MLVLFLSVTKVLAHHEGQPNARWFNDLRSDGGALCCSGNDGLTLSDPDWESKDGHYRVRIEGEWIVVPDHAVVTVPNIDGRAHVWPMRGMTGVSVRCFMPGALT